MHPTDVCYVCGHRGITEIAFTRLQNATQSSTSKIPCFPSLLLISPAVSSKPPSPVDGHVRLCSLCWRLLLEQWKSYEDRKTPLSNRQYWLKCCAANREPCDVAAVAKLNTNRSTAVDTDHVDRSRSSSPDPAEETLARFSCSAGKTAEPNVEGQRQNVQPSVDQIWNAAVEIRSETGVGAVCVVCSRCIESMDVCRRLPAHLVAQVIDVKPTISQNSNQATGVDLTGEALVCDDCFAAPSFQNAWLDCCRRGNQAQHQLPTLNPQRSRDNDQNLATVDFSQMNRNANQALTEAQRQWFALYERALLQYHLTGQLDPLAVGQLQQFAAAEALASLQHSCATSESATRSDGGSH